MIVNSYNNTEANNWRKQAGDLPADQDLAERVYTSRLIGRNPDLLMHGGGNTSVKVDRTDLFGNIQKVLHVKGSGWDLDVIEAPGLPGVWLKPLLKLRNLDLMSDEDMVNIQRSNLLDSSSPNPSVETLLHAFLPHKFVDHTHATPFLILANLPNATDICKEIFGDRLAIVPYIMPGFGLAKKAAEIYDTNPEVEGLLLLNHGHFTFGPSAQKSYDLIISHTNEVAKYLNLKKPTSYKISKLSRNLSFLPVLRGLIAEETGTVESPMPIFDLRNSADVLDFLKRPDIEELSKRGMASPDHVLRTKGRPLLLRKEVWSAGREAIKVELTKFKNEYRDYFARNAPNSSEKKIQLKPDPKQAWIEGVGILGIGDNSKSASAAADLVEQNLRVRAVGEDLSGFYPLNEKDMFDCEYWSLEQAKLGKGKPPQFQGKVVMVTGGAGAIGLATAKAFAAKGANCLLVDINEANLEDALAELGPWHKTCCVDVTAKGSANTAVDVAISHFGGVDILVSNAGTAHSGSMLELDDDIFRKAFEMNFFSHKNFAIEVAKVMKNQARSGQLLFNVSKQAVAPGLNLGAYGLPKSATMFLIRQLAMELGDSGIRVNGINADRIRSGLLTDEFISERAKARKLDESTYMAGNLLKLEVEAKHVADVFVSLAGMERTTGHVITVDGGNTSAELR
jgi:rhamnose utilization protein RhaD (predicted bifunctional aldolase and dehydrogenase)/NAD(P)-dependent dehydrogenase (short-subunit alcohol dehydrogenase family)